MWGRTPAGESVGTALDPGQRQQDDARIGRLMKDPRPLLKLKQAQDEDELKLQKLMSLFPPPAPMVAFMLAAGAMQYSVKKFLVALTLGRIVRYFLMRSWPSTIDLG